MNIEELAFKDRKTLANLNRIDLLNIIEFLQEDRNQWINNESIKIRTENDKLKIQFEKCYCNRTDCSSRIKDSKKYDSLVQAQEAQQKEFIKYLEDEIEKQRKKSKTLTAFIRNTVPLKQCLQKYIEIIEK